MTNSSVGRVLVTGATGYIGGRLVPSLLKKGYQVRVLARDPLRLEGRTWYNQVEVVTGDVLRPETLPKALEGIDVAYYLVHSMSEHADFSQRDISAAQNFGQAAKAAGVKRIIYLGGLGDTKSALSTHLRSRQQTGETLRNSGVPVTEFRAGVVVGAGSVSFEMVRYLTERLPIMITPKWVWTLAQPIAIEDVLNYLVTALETPASEGKIIEIGGKDILPYRGMMLGYAKVRGLKRFLIPVPVLTPKLSSYWVHLMTPIHLSIAQPLIKGLTNEVTVKDHSAQEIFPHIKPVDYATAVQRALDSLKANELETSWNDSLYSSLQDRQPIMYASQEGMLLEQRQLEVKAPPQVIFDECAKLGGQNGWLVLNSLWKIRGEIDHLTGGVGIQRGRRHATRLRVGDIVDFWRVEAITPGRLLRFRAEMAMPGQGWLQFKIDPMEVKSSDLAAQVGRSLLVQTAFYAPKGFLGFMYWYGLFFVHKFMFSKMIRMIGSRAEQRAEELAKTTSQSITQLVEAGKQTNQ